jgi:hypothetical protein
MSGYEGDYKEVNKSKGYLGRVTWVGYPDIEVRTEEWRGNVKQGIKHP